MTAHYRAIVHGRTLELLSDPGLPDGQEVDVQISPTPAKKTGEGILRSDGILADDNEWDQIMADIHQDRAPKRGWDRLAGLVADDPGWDDVMAEIQKRRKQEMPRRVNGMDAE